jgi:hypothetical protein
MTKPVNAALRCVGAALPHEPAVHMMPALGKLDQIEALFKASK